MTSLDTSFHVKPFINLILIALFAHNIPNNEKIWYGQAR